jgi:hypothetical protein
LHLNPFIFESVETALACVKVADELHNFVDFLASVGVAFLYVDFMQNMIDIILLFHSVNI